MIYQLREEMVLFYADINAKSVLISKTEYLIGLFHDTTESKQAEIALRASETRFKQLTESLPQLVWTCRPDVFCDYLSSQWVEFTGMPEAQQLGLKWLEQVHPDERKTLMIVCNMSVPTGKPFMV